MSFNYEGKFKNSINSKVFDVEKNIEFFLVEDGEYKVTVRQAKNNSLIVIQLSEMKSNAKYINSNYMPKDCDYILINPQKEVVFLIELKSKRKTAKEVDVKNQLIAGKKWLEHILFVINLPFNEIKKFRVIPIWIRVNNKMDYKKGHFVGNCNNYIYKSNGPKVDLRNYYKNKECCLTLENFDEFFYIK